MPRRPRPSPVTPDPKVLKSALALLSQHVANDPPRGDREGKQHVRDNQGEHPHTTPEVLPNEVRQFLELRAPDPGLVFDPGTLERVGNTSYLYRPHPEVEGTQGAQESKARGALPSHSRTQAQTSSNALPITMSMSNNGTELWKRGDVVVNERVPFEHQFEKGPNGNPIIPFKRVITPVIHYRSSSPNFMGKFLKTIYNRPELAPRVRSLRFALPHDTLENSGILKLLDPMDEHTFPPSAPSISPSPLPPPHASSSSSSTTPAAGTDDETPLETASWKLEMWIRLFVTPANIPLKTVLELYVHLFSICKYVDEIEIPAEWQHAFACGTAFPRVDSQHIYIVENVEAEDDPHTGSG